MKRITNILSYLCLLLLLLVVACSDLEEIVVNMQGEEEVELTIQTNIPSLGGSTRTAPIENITSITALAFDSDHELIKVVTEGVIQKTETDSTGTFKVKVPLRTRRIHFIAKNNGVFDEITDDDYYGQTDVSLLVDRTSSAATDEDLLNNALHYWAMLDFDNAADLNDLTDELASAPNKDGKLTLIRNMAKLILDTPGENDCIVGFMNYNTNGTLVPYIDNGEEVEFCYQTDTNHDLPNRPIIIPVSEEKDLGKVHYMFEEYNDVGDLVYVICKLEISTDTYKYFKFALKKDTSTYYYIVRNCKYRIKIDDVSKISASGHDTYGEAVANVPINADTEEVNILFEPNPLSMFLDETGEVTVTIPKGITTFSVGYMKNYFIQGGVACTYEPTRSEVTTGDGKELWVDTYTVSGENDEEIVFTIKLKEDVVDKGEAVSGIEIQFQGNGPGKTANKILTVNALLQGSLTVTPTTVEMVNRADTECTVTVKIESYDYNVGDYKLQVGNANGVFAVTAPAGLDLHDDGYYYATKGQSYTFTFALKEAGTAGAEHKIDFDLFTDYHHLEGTTTVTLVEPTAYDSYELWFDNNTKVNGSTDYNYFFDWGETEGITISSSNNLEGTSFYDDGANTHRAQAMVMGQDNSISFTIGATRYLTLLVANDGDDSDTPSIQLSNGSSWTTGGDTEDLTNGTYNFAAEGEITSAGRLIRYELPAGTYTLQGSNAADYLLYYMRVTEDKPVMTDVVTDATASNYTLAWSGGEWGNYTKINDTTYFVDDDATTFTPTLTYKGLKGVKLAASSSLNITTGKYSFSDNQGDGTAITYTEVKSNNNGSDNGDIAIKATVIGNESIIYNAGTYALSGIANVTDTEYKYAAFYDVLRLNTVGFTVKNTIKLGLYYSWNGDANTITEYVDGLPYIIGFRMPYSLPVAINADNDTSTPINFTIDSKWERRESGLGVICNAPNYQLASQQEGNSSNNRVHPRPEWTYKIEWYEVAANTIQPTTKDADIYFSYKDNSGNAYITQSPVIATTKSASEKLALTLDFSSDSENESTHTLNFGDKFYLKATISDGDSRKYAGAHVRFTGSFSNNTQGGGNSAINWTDSREDGSIEYARNSNDGTQLQFKVEAGKTDYEICWQFVRNDGSTTPTQFTYTIDNDAYNITNGSESATIVLNGNGQAVDNPLDLILNFYALGTNGQEVDNGVNGSYTDLQLGTSRFVLEVNIDEADALAYNGQTVYLAGNFETIAAGAAENGWAIHWVNSRTEGAISYYGNDNNGSGLQFKIDGSTSYKIEWVFKTGGNYNGGEIGFDYKISAHANSPTKYNLSGDTQATIAFTNESQILVATNGNQASNNINLSLEYGENSAEEFTVDVPVPNNVTGINISAPDYLAVSIGKLAAADEQYPGDPEAVYGNYEFTDSDNTTAPRFKFKLNGTPTENPSVITFTSADGNASKATVTVNWTQRGAESNQTTIWSGAMDLQWTRNYLEATANQLPAGTQVTLYFTTTGGQIKLHDSSETSISGDSGFAVTNGATQYSFTLQNAVNGLKINGNNVRMTSIVVSTSTASTEPVIDDEDFSNFKNVGQGSVSVEDGILCLYNAEDCDYAWDAQAMYETDGIKYGETYTLTFKAKIDEGTTGGLVVAIQSGGGTYTYYFVGKNISDIFNNVQKDDQGWAEIVFDNNMNITNNDNTDNPTHFMFNFGDLVGRLYIDDLKLVKNNQ